MSEAARTRKPNGQGSIFKRPGTSNLWIAYSIRGKQHRESSGTSDWRKAKQFLKHRLKEVGADEIGARKFVGPDQERVTVAELLDALEKDYRLKGVKAWAQFQSHLKSIREHFGDWRALEVTPAAVDQYIQDRLVANYAPASINRGTQILGQAFRLAVSQGRLSAVPKLRRLPENNRRRGFFEADEFQKLIEALPDYLRDFTRFGYLSAWRKGEIGSLRWSDVNLQEQVIRLREEESKNGEPRILALEGEIREIIERRLEARRYELPDKTTALSALVFHRDGQPIGDFRKAWASACEKAKLPGKLFHDLRRTSVRNMVRAGVGETVAMSISGHKTRSIFDRYNITSAKDIREALKKTQAHLKTTPVQSNVVNLEEARKAASA